MAVTDDEKLADRMRQMSLHGLSHDAWKRFAGNNAWDYRIVAPGYKYNLTDIAAAIGIHQLARAEDMRRERAGDRPASSASNWRTWSRSICRPIRPTASTPGTCSRFGCGWIGSAIDRNAFIVRIAGAGRGLFGALAAAASASVLRGDVRLAAGASAGGVAPMAQARSVCRCFRE